MLRASAVNPMPAQLVLNGSHELLLVLSAKSPETQFELSYHCRPSGHRVGPFYLAPIIYVSVLAALVFLGILACLLPAYALCYCCARRNQERALSSSQLVMHAELLQRRQQVQEQLARAAVSEQCVIGALEALPTQRWHKSNGADSDADQADNCEEGTCRETEETEECCLCLDPYTEEDEVRVLPCEHYFHKVCVDRWFSSRRYMPRSCPKCRRNPVAGDGGQVAKINRTLVSEGDAGEAGDARDDDMRNREDAVVPAHATTEPRQSARRSASGIAHLEDASNDAPSGDDLLPGAVPEMANS